MHGPVAAIDIGYGREDRQEDRRGEKVYRSDVTKADTDQYFVDAGDYGHRTFANSVC